MLFWDVCTSFLYLAGLSLILRLPAILWRVYRISMDWFLEGWSRQADALYTMEPRWLRQLLFAAVLIGWVLTLLIAAIERGWLVG